MIRARWRRTGRGLVLLAGLAVLAGGGCGGPPPAAHQPRTVRMAGGGLSGSPYGVFAAYGANPPSVAFRPLNNLGAPTNVSTNLPSQSGVSAVAINSTATVAMVAYATVQLAAAYSMVGSEEPGPDVATRIPAQGPPPTGVLLINAASGTATGEIALANPPIGLAADPVNPDLAYALDDVGEVYQLDLGTGTATALFDPLPPGASLNPVSIALTPDGQTVLVVAQNSSGSGDVFATSTSQPAATRTWSAPAGNSPVDLAASPDGTRLFVALSQPPGPATPAETVVAALPLPLPLSGDTWSAAVPAIQVPVAITDSPDAGTVYVLGDRNATANGAGGEIQALAAGTGQLGASQSIPIPYYQGGGVTGLAVAPDASTVVVAGNDNTNGNTDLYTLSLPALAPGALTVLSAGTFENTVAPQPLAITPDQAPVASFSSSAPVVTAGQPVTFDPSGSSVTYGSITGFAWSVNGVPAGSSPTFTYTFATPGTYQVTLTETDSAGTSVPPAPGTGGRYPVDDPGQTPYRQASFTARTTRPVTVSPVAPPPTSTPPTSTPPTTTVPAATPTLTLSPTVGPPGTIVTVTGSGFAPNSTVAISWSVSGGSITVKADAGGNLPPSQIDILVPAVLGPRQAVTNSSPPATANFLVVPSSAEPGGSDRSYLFRSEGP